MLASVGVTMAPCGAYRLVEVAYSAVVLTAASKRGIWIIWFAAARPTLLHINSEWVSGLQWLRYSLSNVTSNVISFHLCTGFSSVPVLSINRSNVIRLSVWPFVQWQYFQNPKPPKPVGWRLWNLACIFYWSGGTTSRKQNFEYFGPVHVRPPRT